MAFDSHTERSPFFLFFYPLGAYRLLVFCGARNPIPPERLCSRERERIRAPRDSLGVELHVYSTKNKSACTAMTFVFWLQHLSLSFCASLFTCALSRELSKYQIHARAPRVLGYLESVYNLLTECCSQNISQAVSMANHALLLF